MEEDLDYILSVISNKIRRDIIKIIAEEGPISYTKLMKKLDIKDSGTLGFHIKKMSKLFKKDELGEYVLNDLGLRAYQLINELEEREISTKPEGKYKDIIISDKLRFDYTESLAHKLLEEGKRVILTDIVTLVIHRMPRELLEKTIKEISDCISVKVPKDLYESIILKTIDVLNISVYEKEEDLSKKRFQIPGISLISDILSSIMDSIDTLISFSKFSSVKHKKELYLENVIPLPERFNLDISLNGGVLELIPGEGYIKVWKSGLRDPIVEFRRREDNVEFELGRGYFEIKLPSKSIMGATIGLDGGVVKIKDIEPEKLDLDLNGGYVEMNILTDKPVKIHQKLNGGVIKYELDLRHETGEAGISSDLNGGVCQGKIILPKDTKVNINRETYGGYAYIEINDSKITNSKYFEEGYEDTNKRLKATIRTYGGFSKLKIVKREA
jgi:hypothetical protein